MTKSGKKGTEATTEIFSPAVCSRNALRPQRSRHATLAILPPAQLRGGRVLAEGFDEINTDLLARRELAQPKGWLGELEGIDLIRRFL